MSLFGFGNGDEVGGLPLVWFLLGEGDFEEQWVVDFGEGEWECVVE